MQVIRSLLVVALLGGLAALPLRADDPKPPETKADDTKPVDVKVSDIEKVEVDKDAAKEPAEPAPSVTAHSVTVDGKVIKYHATTGYMVLKLEEGKPAPVTPPVRRGRDGDGAEGAKDDTPKFKDGVKPVAKVFYIAYTVDDVPDSAKRPVTFLFNGGPGSSSLWLHMGSVAPRRAAITDDGESTPPPYGIMDNQSTWLDRTDLVFIDPVSTGFSRPLPKEDAKQFHGLKEDIASIGDFIRLYTTRNSRWLSPKFVLGESYGTLRAAGLSDYLQTRYGMYLNGVIMVSSCLNYQAISFAPQNIEAYAIYLPSYATTAWYHHKLSPAMQAKTLVEIAAEARAFAGGEYLVALTKGDTLPLAEKKRIAERLNEFTGIPAHDWEALNLRMYDIQFFTRLLFNEGRYVGVYDGRLTGVTYAPGETDPSQWYDPSTEAIEPAFTAAFSDYVRRELKFETDLPYEDLADVTPWNFGNSENGFPDTSEDLRHAMTRNPYLKVWVTFSYYDLCTPFFGAENVLAALNLDPSVRANLKTTYYEAGHMLYIRNSERKKFKADFLNFLDGSLNEPVIHAAAP
jgi:carboxypeptidase C (cathepsin A)